MATIVSDDGVLARLRASWRILLKEVAAFGLVGAIAFVVQLGLFHYLTSRHVGPLTSNAIAMFAATVFAYVGNRKYSFSHRARIGLARETGAFFGINAVAFVFSEILVWLFAYPLGYPKHGLVLDFVLVMSIGVGTLFRFWAYKQFVFLHPDKVHAKNVDLDIELSE
jgi:putative flippase GtrA